MSAQDHHRSASDQHAAHDHHEGPHPEEPPEEVLAADESPTPLWLPVLGAVLFFVAFILIAAF